MKKNIIAFLCAIAFCIFSFVSVAAAATYAEAGKSDVGMLYVDLEQVQALRKDNSYFLITAVEERYTDQKFLTTLRQSEGLEKAAGMLTIYMFNNNGSSYSVAHQYLFDIDNNICLDLGGNLAVQDVGNDKTLLKIYEVSLKHIESKQKQLNNANRWLR